MWKNAVALPAGAHPGMLKANRMVQTASVTGERPVDPCGADDRVINIRRCRAAARDKPDNGHNVPASTGNSPLFRPLVLAETPQRASLTEER